MIHDNRKIAERTIYCLPIEKYVAEIYYIYENRTKVIDKNCRCQRREEGGGDFLWECILILEMQAFSQ